MKAPPDQEAVRLVTRVDPVVHRPVEVDQVLDGVGAELHQVEVGVAADQWVKCPLDRRHAAINAPRALVLLELEAQAASLGVRQHAEDVRVKVQVTRRMASQPPDEPAHHALSGVGAHHVIA